MSPAWASSLPAVLAMTLLLLASYAGSEAASVGSGLASDARADYTETSAAGPAKKASGESCDLACADTNAEKLFVDAVKLLVKANDRDVILLQKALKKLKMIRDCLPCSEIAGALSASRGIGGISIEELEREIKILRKDIPQSCCRCSPLYDALKAAMEIEPKHIRDDAIATIVRKLVRRTGDFECAQDVVNLIGEGQKRKSLRGHIARAWARAALKKRVCVPCWGHGCAISATGVD